MSAEIVSRATALRPCPVCGSGTKSCSATADGLHFCRGEPRDGWARLSKAADSCGFHHYRRADEPRRDPGPSHPPAKPALARDWRAEAERCAARLTDAHRAALAAELGLPVESLSALPLLGYVRDPRFRDCWTFPECDAAGRVTAVCRRLFEVRPGEPPKPVMLGGRRGLYLPAGWQERPGPVLVTEGASDALALTLCGLSAVGRSNNAGGAELLAELFRGSDRELIILGENDRKADGQWPGGEGRNVAAKVAKALGRPVAFRLPEDGVKDAREWVRELVAHTPGGADWGLVGREVLARIRDHADPGPAAPPAASPLPLLYYADIGPALDAADFVEGLLADGAMSVIYGDSGSGKTFFTLDLALHVAAGLPWRGRAVDRRGVLYLALEGAHGIKNRVAAFKLDRRAGAAALPFAVVPVALDLLAPDGDALRVVAAARAAAGALAVPVGLVVVDTLSRAMAGGNENASEDMGALVRHVDLIRQALPAHLAVVHHSGKDGAKGARGHSLLRAATDTEVEVARDRGAGVSVATVTKQRELETGDAFPFRLAPVELGLNRRGKVVTSCVVREVEATDEAAPGPVPPADEGKGECEADKVLAAIEAECAGDVAGATITRIRARSKLGHYRALRAVKKLVADGVIEPVDVVKTGGNSAEQGAKGWRKAAG